MKNNRLGVTMNNFRKASMLTFALCSMVVCIDASENQKKQFFDASTVVMLKRVAKQYARVYAYAWGAGNVLCSGVMLSLAPFGVILGMVFHDEKLIDEALSPWSTIKAVNHEVSTALLESTIVTAPLVFGAA